MTASERLGVRPSTIERIISGKRMSSPTIRKIESILKQGFSPTVHLERRKSREERFRLAHKLYIELGTLEAAAKEMGLTRERVRQLLVKGDRLGLFQYKPFNYPYISREKLVSDWTLLLSAGKVAAVNDISSSYLKKLMTAYAITEDEIAIFKQDGRRARCIEQYNRLRDHLGHHPTTTELQNTTGGHTLHARINRLWGTIDTFRESLNIPKPDRLDPVWLEPRRQLAFFARMQHLDTVRELLSFSNPMTLSEMVSESGFKPNRVRRLLALLLASGEVRKVGTRSGTKYLLANR